VRCKFTIVRKKSQLPFLFFILWWKQASIGEWISERKGNIISTALPSSMALPHHVTAKWCYCKQKKSLLQRIFMSAHYLSGLCFSGENERYMSGAFTWAVSSLSRAPRWAACIFSSFFRPFFQFHPKNEKYNFSEDNLFMQKFW